MSLENRNSSALFKRAEQLRRWDESETNREVSTPKDNERRIMFSDGCVFLAACAAGDKSEVLRLLDKGVDIDTANVDGLTALHQACIDDNLDMVEFLVEHGADVNSCDNEGWTPLHATSSCDFLSIAKYLIDQGGDVAAVNNDGELAIDICESDEMGDLLQHEIDIRGIDCEESRTEEENMMLKDARQWLNSGQMTEQSHPKTGATALHVAAAKGYIKVMNLLFQCGADINAQDYDGWTPLHAAAHWAQREACELLAENLCNMDIKNYVGQTAFDVADPDVLTLLEQLKKKQVMMQKERPEIEHILTRRPLPPFKRRSSVTRMSGSDKTSLVSRDASAERERLQDQLIEEDVSPQPPSPADLDPVELRNKNNQPRRPAPGFVPRPPDGSEPELDQQSWRRPVSASGTHRDDPTTAPPRAPQRREEAGSRLGEPTEVRRTVSAPPASSPTSPASPPPPPPEQPPTVTATIIQTTPTSPVTTSAPAVRSTKVSGVTSVLDGRPPVKEPAAAAAPPLPPAAAAAAAARVQVDQQPATGAASKLSPATIFKNIFKSFVPPVRDEESETQRKAHAKRVRETRRSTQGVTLEELKSAEQYVKNQQQQQKAAGGATTAAPTPTANPPPATTASTNNPSTAPAAAASREDPQQPDMERRPSWRLRLDENDKNKEVQRGAGDRAAGPASPEPDATVTLPLRRKSNSAAPGQTAAAAAAEEKEDDKENDSRTAVATQAAIQRRRKPKRRSTGVVQFDMEENEKKEAAKEGGASIGDSAEQAAALSSHSNTNTSEASSRAPSRTNSVENGEIDYKKLYEEAMVENDKLRERLAEAQAQLRDVKSHLDKTLQLNSSRTASSEADKRERRAIERKLSEMEEELKAMEELKAENRRLRDENGALIRVISKLSK